ncbi:MAG: hypothetical protein Q7R49_07040 [Candidatus Daviesbacteria bacterium]|nr:hypothetical protein [Candidatus Daviesbacteria bacterium]
MEIKLLKLLGLQKIPPPVEAQPEENSVEPEQPQIITLPVKFEHAVDIPPEEEAQVSRTLNAVHNAPSVPLNSWSDALRYRGWEVTEATVNVPFKKEMQNLSGGTAVDFKGTTVMAWRSEDVTNLLAPVEEKEQSLVPITNTLTTISETPGKVVHMVDFRVRKIQALEQKKIA